jgi:hypothetical protein
MWKQTKVMRISRKLSPVQIMIEHTQMEYEEYLKYLVSMITDYTRYTYGIQSRIAMAKAAFHKKKTLLPASSISFKEKTNEC